MTDADNDANVKSPSVGSHRSSFPLGSGVVLPTELYETLNYIHFLHSLAVNPNSVLPPGKSLLSVLSKPHETSQPSDLRQRVETIVHKVFWDEVRHDVYADDALAILTNSLPPLGS